MAKRLVIIGRQDEFCPQLAATLQQHGFASRFAEKATCAIRQCRQGDIHGILIMGGCALVEENLSLLRLHPVSSRLGIIVLTDADGRLPALLAGADDALSAPYDPLLLLARLRNLRQLPAEMPDLSMAEGGAYFTHLPKVALVTPDKMLAESWQLALAAHLDAGFETLTAQACLTNADNWTAADIYLIAADQGREGDGLRLMSLLRDKPAMEHAAYLIALTPEDGALAPMALDLGAGDVLPVNLQQSKTAQEAAIRIKNLLRFNRRSNPPAREQAADTTTALLERDMAIKQKPAILRAIHNAGGHAALMLFSIGGRHQALDPARGEVLLGHMASLLEGRFAAPAMIARIGSAEIMVICSVTSRCDAFTQAEAIRDMFFTRMPAAKPADRAGKQRPSLTIGIAVFQPDNIETETCGLKASAGKLLVAADLALLSAKKKGGNRTEISA